MGSSLMFLVVGDALAARWASSGSMAPEDAMKRRTMSCAADTCSLDPLISSKRSVSCVVDLPVD